MEHVHATLQIYHRAKIEECSSVTIEIKKTGGVILAFKLRVSPSKS